MPRKKTGETTTEGFSVRVPSGLREFIEWDVEENREHATRNEWIVRAIEHYKEYRLDQITKTKQASTLMAETVRGTTKKSGRV